MHHLILLTSFHVLIVPCHSLWSNSVYHCPPDMHPCKLLCQAALPTYSTDYTRLQAPNISHHEPDHSHPLWTISLSHGSYSLLALSQPALNSVVAIYLSRTLLPFLTEHMLVMQAKYTLCTHSTSWYIGISCLAHCKWLKRHHCTITTVPIAMILH